MIVNLGVIMSQTHTTSPENLKLLKTTLYELFDKIDHYMCMKPHVGWDGVLKHIHNARDEEDLFTKYAESNLAVKNWNNVRNNRKQRTLTDVKYEQINELMFDLEQIIQDIHEIQDTKAPQADLRKLLRCLQTASVDGPVSQVQPCPRRSIQSNFI